MGGHGGLRGTGDSADCGVSQGFSAEWLRLREPYDLRARSAVLLQRLARWCAGRRRLKVIDLGAGTGSNLRCMAPALGIEQDWTLVERDTTLIEAGREQLADSDTRWRYRRLDLATDLEQLAGEDCDLVTAAALIDLVSAGWLGRLAAIRRQMKAALYVALSFDGRMVWDPGDALDDAIAILVGAHQRKDKGFGPAIGPGAARELQTKFGASDGAFMLDRSDWLLGPDDRTIQEALLCGYEAACVEVDPERSARLRAWADRRRALIATGRSCLRVGHRDLLLLPR
jgi:hypothetical protein